MEVGATVDGTSFYEVTFLARSGTARGRPIGTDDNRAVPRLPRRPEPAGRARRVRYRAIVLDNAGHTRTADQRRPPCPRRR